MEVLEPSLFVTIQRCAQEFLLTRPLGVMMNHLSLAQVFEEVEKNKISKRRDLYRARIGSKIKLLDKQTLTTSTITLTKPDDSDVHDGKLSCLSMLGSELLGAISGQHISISVLGRSVEFQVLGVENAQPIERR